MRNAPPLEVILETGKRVLREFQTRAGLHVLTHQVQVHVSIG